MKVRPFREAFIQRAWNQSQSLVLRVVLNKEFLNTNINNKDIYVDSGAIEDIPEDAYSLKWYGWTFDSIELKQVAKVLKIKYQKVSTFLQLSQQVTFDLFILFLSGLDRNARLDFGFPSNFTASYIRQLGHVQFTFFRSLADGYSFHSAIQLNWLEKFTNQPPYSQKFDIIWVNFLQNHHEFYCRLLAARFDLCIQ